jgi:DNA-binding HxlR family transcriptional regulator
VDKNHQLCYTVSMIKYGQYCPVAKATEILGDRWTLLIVRDLIYGARHFNALERGLPGIPRAILTNRLKRLQLSGIIVREAALGSQKVSYSLTPAGLALTRVMDALSDWGARWVFGEPDESELDPVLLLWWMHSRVYRERLPEQRVVIEFDFWESRPVRFWLVLTTGDVSVCMTHPGFDVNMLVTAELKSFYQVWSGTIAFKDALRNDKIQLDALPALIHDFPKWFMLSPFADSVQAAGRK